MGRKANKDVWKLFDQHITTKNNKEIHGAKCKHCGYTLQVSNATRMQSHIENDCEKIPPDLKTKFLHSAENSPDIVNNIGSNVSPGSAGAGPSKPNNVTPTSRGKISSFMDKISPREQNCSECFARAVYGTGLPFHIFEHPLWIEAFKTIRPSFKPPNAKLLGGGGMLDNEASRVENVALEKINNAQCLALMCDGWTNIRGESLINVVVCTPDPVFYKVIEPGTNRETGIYLAEQLEKVILDVNPQKVLLFNADNAANMKLAGQLLKKKFPHIYLVGCGGHSLNLLCSDLAKISSLNNLIVSCKAIVKCVRNRHVLLAKFCEVQEETAKRTQKPATTLKKPSKTRFAGVQILLKSVKDNREPLQRTVLVPDLDINKNLKTFVLDDEFWKVLNVWLSVLTALAVAIAKIESNSALLSDLPYVFTSLQNDIVRAISVPDQSVLLPLKKRLCKAVVYRQKFVCKGVHFAACMLDPRYKGTCLSDDEKIQAVAVIQELAHHLALDVDDVMKNFAEFRTETGIWQNQSVRSAATRLEPRVWWQGLCAEQPLQLIASRLLSLPVTQAECERTWSCFSRVHTKSRNRLKNDKVVKSVRIQMNLAYASDLVKKKKASVEHPKNGATAPELSSSSDSEENEEDIRSRI